eukprot:NODE_9574_length_1413_cov_9.327372.p1 GENE.NODE_9574_length_1413_cov_9.327372~~NODE_9574_length_1413_cov_9.327372.p1  ORF type:complete len:330 (-),score=55.29 NODE_9574_length_1413_cov_9.327372:307-1296(-)
MSSNDPLLSDAKVDAQDDPKAKRKAQCISCLQHKRTKLCCGVCWLIILVIFCCAWILQGLMYWVGTASCSSGSLKGYDYPGGGVSKLGNATYNLVPRITLLKERVPQWFGEAFDVIPSNEASTISEAPCGNIWKTWGPIFNSYVYQDVAASQETLYMRPNLLRLGMSHRIGRCDGKGPLIWIEEGSNFISNAIRHAFGMSQAVTFKLYVDDDYVATVEETNTGLPSLTFVTVGKTLADRKVIASAVLKNPFSTTPYDDEWLVSNFPTTILPYWTPTMATSIFSFAMVGSDRVSNRHSAKQEVLATVDAPMPEDKAKLFLEKEVDEVEEV